MKKIDELVKDNNFSFKKKFGQNFLLDDNIIKKIIDISKIKSDSLILEIGPGAGFLTKKLVNLNCDVLCYEIDKSLSFVLDEINSKNLNIIYDDFLNRDIANDIKKYSNKDIYVVANLPYYITTSIILKIIDSKININKMVIMVQKEVGERFSSLPGNKSYNSLTVFLNYYFDIKKEIDVSRNVFFPKPNVDSVVVSLTSKEKKEFVYDEALFFNLVRNSFRFKRKTLKNNLREYDLVVIEKVLKKYGLNLGVRAEYLELKIFVDISNELYKSHN